MKIFFCISFLLFFPFLGIAQPPNYDATCDEGNQKAIQDAQKGQYYLYAYGLILMNPKQSDKNDFEEKYLKENFNIHLGLGGCIVTAGGDCYGDKMVELISNKFGENFFDSINPIINSLYEINVQERIDNDIVFERYDSLPGFIGGEDFLVESIKQSMHSDSINKINGKVSIMAIISNDGTIKNAKIHHGINEYYDTICLRAVMNIKQWKPAVLNGQNVASRILIPINFN